MAYETEEEARDAANLVVKCLGAGWEIQVYCARNDSVWRYTVNAGNIQVFEHSGKYCARIATPSGGCVATESRDDPLKAVWASIKHFRNHRTKTNAIWDQVEADLPCIPGQIKEPPT